MRYSILGNTGLQASVLGFGCMRLPMKNGLVNREKSTPLLLRAVELGVNFFDTAVFYCNSDSQAAVGDAMLGIRNKVVLSTKNHLRANPVAEWRTVLEDSLRLLQTDYIDIYNIHGLNWKDFVEHFDPAKGGKVAEMLRAREEGLIRHVAFSFHDTPENLVKCIDTGYFENVILQYNLLDQANAQAMHHAREKGLGVVVMGPVGGGKLGLPSERISELCGGDTHSTPEAALRFVWGHPAVNVALSGMENLAMLEENVRIADQTEPFSAKQLQALDRMVEDRKSKSGLYCSGCGYCLPVCPQDVNIPENLNLLNRHLIFGLSKLSKDAYNYFGGKAADCIACGACEPKCPQKIHIRDRLKETALALDSRAGSVVVNAAITSVENNCFTACVETQNFGDKPYDISVRIEPVSELDSSTVTKFFPALAPMKQGKLSFQGTIPANCEINYQAHLEYNGANHVIEGPCRSILLSKGLSDTWESGPWFRKDATASEFEAFPALAPLHGFLFKLSYDESGLLLMVDVRDDFLFPSKEESHKGLLIDNLEIFLDGRGPDRIGRRSYEQGVCQLFLYPGTPGEYPAFVNSHQKVDVQKIRIEGTPAPQGYRIKAFIPFDFFCTGTGIPKQIGFDIAADTADADGNRIAHYIYAGTSQNWQDASAFKDIWLV